MGFDAFIQVLIHFGSGRPYFFHNNLTVYDLSQIPKIPDEFLEFEALRGHSWRALLESTPDENYGSDDTLIEINTIFPDYKTMCEHESYVEDDFTEADVQKFKAFCDWVRGTGVEFYYFMSW